jgi:hypothetical protein
MHAYDVQTVNQRYKSFVLKFMPVIFCQAEKFMLLSASSGAMKARERLFNTF